MNRQLFLTFFILYSSLFALSTYAGAASEPRTRIIVTSDGEIDDQCSLVRFLLYANEWDIEAIITSSSQYHWHGHKWEGDTWYQPFYEAYGKVQPNLLKHDSRYPSLEELQRKTFLGNVELEGEMGFITPGSQRIVEVLLDRTDPRPVWIQAWGGTNTIARALKTIEETHPEEMARVAAKIRFYFIWEQDATYQQYILPHWGHFNIPTIICDQFEAVAYRWRKSQPEQMHPFLDADFMNANILKDHGPLCALYPSHPNGDFRSEGDSPAYFHVIPTGLRSDENPGWGGWGGRFVKVRDNNVWLDPVAEEGYQYPKGRWYGSSGWGRQALRPERNVSRDLYLEYFRPIWRWTEPLQNDFAARADWCVKDYEHANHQPVVKCNLRDVVAKPGETISLSAVGTTDPDGDLLAYRWWQYDEACSDYQAGKQGCRLTISNADSQMATVKVPADAKEGLQLHVVLEVKDNGTPQLTRYARVVVNVTNKTMAQQVADAEMHRFPEAWQAQERQRILVSTDIGGTDPDDNQSMVHLLMYSDHFDIEGLVSTASFGAGSKEEILRMIDLYARDYPDLSAHYASLMSPDALRALAKQGSKREAPLCGYDKPTEGSEWIVRCARKNDDRPLWILVWGCLEDVAQALHDAPDIAAKIRVNWIGGPNKKWGANSYNYIVTHFPDLWLIEDNASYRGFIGSEKDNSFYGAPFWKNCMDGHGAMAQEYIKWYKGNSKMGDTPTLLYLMGQGFNPDKPDSPHWGGQFERIAQSPKYVITDRLCVEDTVSCYSLMEWRLKGPKLEESKDKRLRAMKDSICFIMRTDKQDWRGNYEGNGIYVVRYSPKAPATLTYTITSSIKGFPVHEGVFVVGQKWPAVNEYRCKSRGITSVPVALGKTWWSDASDASLMSGVSDDTAQGGGDYSALNGKWQGAGTIARWRNDVMRDWAERFSKITNNH